MYDYLNTDRVVVLAHSMGGVVARVAFSDTRHPLAVLTMATPHLRPPTPFSRRLFHVYDQLVDPQVPTVSINGGAGDKMVSQHLTYGGNQMMTMMMLVDT